ncbi:MAG: M3 family oligoendopeptidase [Deltaproteobacteria bacterium]|jgi:oligoendopeptidase F|nr:M3 family oligoendopeptidase [Deltaproteobacteria bacterium]
MASLPLDSPHWDLSLLYPPDSPALSQDVAKLRELSQSFGRWRAPLASPDFAPARFKELLDELLALEELASKVSGYASLFLAQDNSSQKALSLNATVDDLLADLANDTLFFELWWKNLPAEKSAPYLAVAPEISHYLQKTRSFQPYTLSEKEEKAIKLKDSREQLTTLYETLNSRLSFTLKAPGREERPLSREELSVYFRSPDPQEREAAYREFYRVFEREGPILGLLYQFMARNWRNENLRLRSFSKPISARNLLNDLPDEAVATLLEVAEREVPRVFGRYFDLKAKILGLPKLRRYDLYAPLLGSAGEPRPFAEGLEEVARAFRAFSPLMEELALKVPREKRLSGQILAGKQSGAFCSSFMPRDVPWVLMSYQGRRQDLFTLAHELGHAVHSQLAAPRGLWQFEASLPLAETASTFGEMLLYRNLKKRETDPAARRDLLFHLLDDAYATVGRQAYFALFEEEAHSLAADGATVDEIAEAYFRNLERQFGDHLDLAPEFRWEWVAIPHFYRTPFYVYAYSFGQLLVYSLWKRYEEEGESFVPKLLGILGRGASASPAAILAEAGVGPLDARFWEGGFAALEGFLAELG